MSKYKNQPSVEPPPVSTPLPTQSPSTTLDYPHTLKTHIRDGVNVLLAIRTWSKTVIPYVRVIPIAALQFGKL